MSEYNKDDLKGTLSKIDDLVFKAKQEFYAQDYFNREVLSKIKEYNKEFECKVTKHILAGIEHLEGRTVKRVTSINSWGSSSNYLFFECEDGQRVFVHGNSSNNSRVPDVDIDKMIKADIFTQKEIEDKKSRIQREQESRDKRWREEKKRKLERLQAELEDVK